MAFPKKIPVSLRKYYGVENLDEKLEKYLDYGSGYFVELGANDGLNQSNTTYYFEKFRGWRGVLIEPSPHNYLRLLANRSGKNHMFCNACVSFTFSEQFVEIVYSNLVSGALNLESDIMDPISHAEDGRDFLEKTDRIFTFGDKAKTLNEILIQTDSPKIIDLLSLDVEGAEIEVLKGLDHTMFKFKYLLVESRNFDKINSYLTSNGYSMVQKLSVHDYLFTSLK